MIKEIYVEKGDEVQKGRTAARDDTAELQIEIERKKLDISTIENNIERQKYKYEMLKTQTPVKKDPPKLNEEQLAWYQHMDEENRLTETDKNDGRIYNYLTATSIPYNVTTNAAGELVYPAGTAEESVYLLCQSECIRLWQLFQCHPSYRGGGQRKTCARDRLQEGCGR